MRILIDVDELQASGILTPQLAASLRQHAVRDNGGTAINLLLAFGAIAIAAGLLALNPTPALGAGLGFSFVILGALINRYRAVEWGKLGSTWIIVGALILCGGVGALIDRPLEASLIAGAILFGTGVLAGSRLLFGLTPLALASAIGGSTGYWHACYMISVQEPTLTIGLFSLLAFVAWQISKRLHGLYQTLALVFTRVSIVLVNFGFWIGSLWGDTPGRTWQDPEAFWRSYGEARIPDTIFVIGWAVALVGAGAWGAKNGNRFMVNTAAVFGAIHFYTQWFERLGVHPVGVIVAGIATVAFGLALWKYNSKVLAAAA